MQLQMNLKMQLQKSNHQVHKVFVKRQLRELAN